jgi:hypothetical protein
MPKWTVTIEHHDTDEPCKVQFTTSYDDKAMGDARFGYPCDEALGFAIGEAMRGVSRGDEDPWLLATMLNLMFYVDMRCMDDGLFLHAAQAIERAHATDAGVERMHDALDSLAKDSQ